MTDRPIVVVSNRGPVSFRSADDGNLVARRGAGGLVSGLSPLMRRTDRAWVAAALSPEDHAAIAAGSDHRTDIADASAAAASRATRPSRTVELDGIRAVLVDIDPDDLSRSYDTVCNATLWYVHHHLFDLARQPVFDRSWFDAWESYVRVNHDFADLVADIAPPDAAVLVQDYHLYLTGARLAELRPDVATVHFSHTPFADPHQFAALPERIRSEILSGLASYHACGFHTADWRDAFVACCSHDGIAAPPTFVGPLGPDAADLDATKTSPAFTAAATRLDAQVGGRLCVARSDRIELSKNLIRGFLAFDELLGTHPEWRERVVFVASVYPSRMTNPDYVAYRDEAESCVAAVNRRWGTDDWTPILLDTSDDFPTSMAMLARADVVLVNPIRDGLNLVAAEAMLINERGALLALSPQAGIWSLLGDGATAVHPYDVVQTAEVLHDLLGTSTRVRADRATHLRILAAARTPADWLADQLAAVP